MANPRICLSRHRWMILAVLCLVVPSVAWANAGTPLIWAKMLHLLFGNAIIGLGEGLVLSALFGLRRGRSVGAMIVANYASAWVGGATLLEGLALRVPANIENLRPWFWTFVALAFVVTLVVEYPMVRLALGRRPNGWRVAAKGVLLVNAISYPLLFGWYWLASGTSLLTGVSVMRAEELQPSPEYALYYLTTAGDVMRSDLTGARQERVATLGAVDHKDRLYVRQGARGTFDLTAIQMNGNREQTENCAGAEDFALKAAVDERMRGLEGQELDVSWYNFGEVGKLGVESPWSMRVGFWPVEGITASRTDPDAKLRFSLETPFVQWLARNATHLKGNLVLFQLGDDQICLLDPLGKRIALVVRGQGPVVALGEPGQVVPAGAVPVGGR
ncbi:MAG: hypothetical protein IPL39_11595 [Opitutaceae bacterium]|nr:hypothetical protein [Opitutaceae bacterium]